VLTKNISRKVLIKRNSWSKTAVNKTAEKQTALDKEEELMPGNSW
jgi:hypothetical protein